ncbi:hypothetical protein ACN28S_35875 [Cystobacter fuscus]
MSPRHASGSVLALLLTMNLTAPSTRAASLTPLTLQEVLDSTRERHPGVESARQGRPRRTPSCCPPRGASTPW